MNLRGNVHADAETHKALVNDAFYHRKNSDSCHYSPGEETSPEYAHNILVKHGYTPVTKSKADSRVSLPKHTHYEKDGTYSAHSAQIHHKDGDVSHISFKTSRSD